MAGNRGAARDKGVRGGVGNRGAARDKGVGRGSSYKMAHNAELVK